MLVKHGIISSLDPLSIKLNLASLLRVYNIRLSVSFTTSFRVSKGEERVRNTGDYKAKLVTN